MFVLRMREPVPPLLLETRNETHKPFRGLLADRRVVVIDFDSKVIGNIGYVILVLRRSSRCQFGH